MEDRTLIHDISHWQGNLSTYWQMFKDKGCQAVIAKSTEGLAYWNIFHEHVQQARAAGFLVGSYHYFRQQIKNLEGTWVNCDPIRQANNYYSWVNKYKMPMDLPPALDVEPGNNPFLNAGSIEKCLREIEKLFGRTPIIYSSPNVLINMLGTPQWDKYPLWLAHYTTEDKIMLPKAWDRWTIWQFSDKITYDKKNSAGTIISRKPIDHNWFNGDIIELYKFCGIGEPGPEPPPDYQEEPPVIIPKEKYIKIIAKQKDGKPGWVHFRNRPEYYEDAELAVGNGRELKLLDPDPINGWWHVLTADGRDGYVRAREDLTKLVEI